MLDEADIDSSANEVDTDDPVADDSEAKERPPWGSIALGVAVVVFAAVAVVAVLVALSARKDSNQSKEELKVRTVASQLAEAVTTLNGSGDNGATAEVVHRLGTGPFLAQYDEGIDSYVKLYKATGASAHGDVLGTFVGQVNPGDKEADAIVVVNLVVSGQASSAPVELYLKVHLVHLGGEEWKVDGLTNINARLAATGATPSPAAPSTTVAPPTSS